MTPTGTKGEAPLRSDHDIVLARQLVRRITQELKFSLVDQTKMVTATSELARNALIYGRGGMMHWEILTGDSRNGLKLLFADQGPGIPEEFAKFIPYRYGFGCRDTNPLEMDLAEPLTAPPAPRQHAVDSAMETT